MPLNRRMLEALSATALLGLSLAVCLSKASAATTPTPTGPIDPVVAYIAATEGVTVDVAAGRALDESKAYDIGVLLKQALGERYGGIFSDDESRLNVLIVSARSDDAAAVASVGAPFKLTTPILIRSAAFSEDALQRTADQVTSALLRAIPDEPMTAGPDLLTQQVVATVAAGRVDAAQAAIAGLQTAGTPAIAIKTYDDQTIPHYTSCNPAGGCNPPLRGGMPAVSSPSYSTACTWAFNAYGKSDGARYALIAGHCLAQAGATGDSQWVSYQADSSAHVVGSNWNSNFYSGGDAAIIKVANPSGWGTPRNWVHVFSGPAYSGGSPDPTADESYTITGISGNSVGTRVCYTGATQYGHSACGKTTAVGQSLTGCPGGPCVTTYNEAVMNAPNNDGDSGGPVYASNEAFGIVSGGAGSSTYYTGSIQAQNDMNVWIYTSP